MKVIATNMYEVLNKKAKELNRIPAAGETFEIADDKFELLHGNNQHNAIFVEKYVEPEKIEEPDKKKVTKKNTKKKKTK